MLERKRMMNRCIAFPTGTKTTPEFNDYCILYNSSCTIQYTQCDLHVNVPQLIIYSLINMRTPAVTLTSFLAIFNSFLSLICKHGSNSTMIGEFSGQ